MDGRRMSDWDIKTSLLNNYTVLLLDELEEAYRAEFSTLKSYVLESPTVTGIAYFQDAVGVGTQNPQTNFDVVNSGNTYARVRTSGTGIAGLVGAKMMRPK